MSQNFLQYFATYWYQADCLESDIFFASIVLFCKKVGPSSLMVDHQFSTTPWNLPQFFFEPTLIEIYDWNTFHSDKCIAYIMASPFDVMWDNGRFFFRFSRPTRSRAVHFWTQKKRKQLARLLSLCQSLLNYSSFSTDKGRVPFF